MPVDLYVGGWSTPYCISLYARFWHKVLYDLGHVSTPEPFMKLVHQGMILGEDNQKMSKSRGNVVNPDVIEAHGADAMRLFEMFMGPLEATKPWNTSGVDGVRRFLNRVWRLIVDEESGALLVTDDAPSAELTKLLHKTIKKVTEDLEEMRFNTAISAMMELTNGMTKSGQRARSVAEVLVQLLAPFAPHMGEELWARLGHGESIAYHPWPEYDEALTVDQTVTYASKSTGRCERQIDLAKDLAKDDALASARANENVARHLEGKRSVEIFVPGRMINFVVS